MTDPALHGPGFDRHEPSVKHINVNAETSFPVSCSTMAFPSRCCSLLLYFEEPSCDQYDGFSLVLKMNSEHSLVLVQEDISQFLYLSSLLLGL